MELHFNQTLDGLDGLRGGIEASNKNMRHKDNFDDLKRDFQTIHQRIINRTIGILHEFFFPFKRNGGVLNK